MSVGFSDTDWAGDINDRKSTSGYIFQISSGAVSWKSKKQGCVALSTTHNNKSNRAPFSRRLVFVALAFAIC